jgi:hypothetical protein
MFFQPAGSAIYLEKLEGKRKNSDLDKLVGPFGVGDPAFAAVAAEIADIERNAVYIAGLGR